MKRRGFFKAALALLGLKAVPYTSWTALDLQEEVGPPCDYAPEGWEWVQMNCECQGRHDCDKCLGIIAILERKGSHLHVS